MTTNKATRTNAVKANMFRNGVKKAHRTASQKKDNAEAAALIAQILGATGNMGDDDLAGVHDAINEDGESLR